MCATTGRRVRRRPPAAAAAAVLHAPLGCCRAAPAPASTAAAAGLAKWACRSARRRRRCGALAVRRACACPRRAASRSRRAGNP
eukprot:366130-Chlamydomonas_euryale.AAC.12